jgi:hypothetical protein
MNLIATEETFNGVVQESAPVEQIPAFESYPKIPRLKRNCVITEKIDGTNAQILITEDNRMFVGSRSRWLSVGADNFGFHAWTQEHKDELMKLGPGRHFGEWYGGKIQRGYGLTEKRFSLFNVMKWKDQLFNLPEGVSIVPILHIGEFTDTIIDHWIQNLRMNGSRAVPGFAKPEGIVVYHMASRTLFKRTLDQDESPKGTTEEA